MEYHDYYATLGVDKGASHPDIQRAYRKLARQYHPDINREDGAEARFKQIGEAYEVLKDPDKRAKYDQFGNAWKTQQRTGEPPPGWEDFRFDFGSGGPGGGQGGFHFGGDASGFSSFFDMLFGGSQGGFSQSQAAPRRGPDHRSTLRVSLEDVASGAKRKVTLADPETGQTRTLEISVPRGVRPGQKMRLTGRGGSGTGGGPRGDLLLTIELERHPAFRVDGHDLLTSVEVSPSRAALGGEARVTTLEGTATVKLPAGSSSGRRIRLRGKGLPKGNDGRGDLFGEVKIVVPGELTDKQRTLFEQLAELENDGPA